VKRLLLCAAVAFPVLVFTARAEPSDGFGYDRELGIIARETLWQAVSAGTSITRKDVLRVYVRCYRSKQSFERGYERRFRRPAARVVAYYAGGPDVHLRKGTCTNVWEFLRGRRTVLTAGAYAVLLHESLHRQGVENERITTCFANEAVRWGTEWLGASEAQALRARNLAFAYTRIYSHPSYRMGKPNCLALARRSDWVDFS
jgi:hypothetical protein